jgi:hypothetical protein
MSSDSQNDMGQSLHKRDTLLNKTNEGNKYSNLTEEEEPLMSRGGIKRDGITRINMSAYAVGHVYNDF